MLKKIGIAAIAVIVTSLSVTVCWLYIHTPKVAFVNLSKAYNSFELKKELEKKLTSVQSAREQSLDSLKMKLTVLSAALEKGEADDNQKKQFTAHKAEFLYKDKSYAEDNEAMAAQYDEQVWTQLNQYINEYSQQKGYTMVVGGDGTGAIMYAQNDLDITDEIIRFANERYKGK